MTRCYFMPLVMTLCAADFQGPADLSVVKDELEGTWAVLPAREVHWVFSGTKVEMLRSGRKVNEGTFHVDSSRSPPAIDMTIPSTRSKYLGIYRIDGNDLVLRDVNANSGARPTSFVAGPGTTLRFKRVRK